MVRFPAAGSSMLAGGADAHSHRSRGGSSRRISKRFMAAAIGIFTASALIIMLQTGWKSSACNSAQFHAATSARLLQPAAHADARSINWQECLEPKAADEPMTKAQFLQEKPARYFVHGKGITLSYWNHLSGTA